MRQHLHWPFIVCLVLLPLAARAQSSTSAATAKTLCDLMTAQHLEAVAAQDANNPNHFVAALFYPHAQLLVISAQYSSPQALQGLLNQKSYRDIYADLQSGQGVSDQLFFIDMLANGLSAGHGDGVDVMYEPRNKQTVFDEDWRKQHGLGEREYLEKYQAADQLYGLLLKTLIGALTTPMAAK